jgi:hypothetical protein
VGAHRSHLRSRGYRPRRRHRDQAAASAEETAGEGVTMRTTPSVVHGADVGCGRSRDAPEIGSRDFLRPCDASSDRHRYEINPSQKSRTLLSCTSPIYDSLWLGGKGAAHPSRARP